jgi:hypothetical protein
LYVELYVRKTDHRRLVQIPVWIRCDVESQSIIPGAV